MRIIKVILLLLTSVLLLSACASAPEAAPMTVPADSEKEALQAEVDALSGKVEQLQDKVEALQKENQALQDDSTVSAAEDLTYLMDVISNSGQTLTSFPAIVTGIAASGEGFMLTIDRLEYNPEFDIGEGQGGPYLLNAEVAPEDVYAGPFTYAYYDGYLMPELDEGFADYIAGFESGAQFTVYMLGDQVIFLNEIIVP